MSPAPPPCRGGSDASPGNSPGGGHINPIKTINTVSQHLLLTSIPDSPQPRTTGSTDLGASAGNGVYYVNEPSRSPDSEGPLADPPVSSSYLGDILALCRGLLLRTCWEGRFLKGSSFPALQPGDQERRGKAPPRTGENSNDENSSTKRAPSRAITSSQLLISLAKGTTFIITITIITTIISIIILISQLWKPSHRDLIDHHMRQVTFLRSSQNLLFPWVLLGLDKKVTQADWASFSH